VAAVPVQKLGEKIFVYRDLTVFESRQFAFVVVDENDVVAEVGEAGASD
jgi:hypothetical protein